MMLLEVELILSPLGKIIVLGSLLFTALVE